jgi:hypothetical protein
VFRTDGLIVMGINTARPLTASLDGFWKDGRISAEQLLDIQLHAKDTPGSMFKIVVTHHPFIPPPGRRTHGIVHGATKALATLEAVGIDMLLAGHLHTTYSGDVRSHHEAVKRSILSVQASTATSTRTRGDPNAYNWITIDGSAHDALATIEARSWTGAEFAPSAAVRFKRVNGIWEKQNRD